MSELAKLQSESEVKVDRVDFEGGKYSICLEDGGRVYLLRNGEPWDMNPHYAKMLIAILYDKRLGVQSWR
jgi:hypothetical protein